MLVRAEKSAKTHRQAVDTHTQRKREGEEEGKRKKCKTIL